MAMFEFKVTPDDGDPFEVSADSRDVLVWERTNHGKRVMATLLDNMSITDMYQVAHIAARRQGLYPDDLKTFEQTCVLGFDASEPPDPTPPDQSNDD